MQLIVKEMFLDGMRNLLEYIGKNYDPESEKHLVYISSIGSVGLTDTYKGERKGKHQIFKDVVLEINCSKATGEKLDELKRITNS